ncbi:peptide transporter PTR2 [Musa troglodytarum]|uniref:Peptide transporter PTR2 n=1 Tax=Musa troglodytarum TaxID=320322 RepID=A0A9E7GSK9_9LILI|nr:peptide transporter PTR2 [Musa troglodytarum]
MSRYAGTESRIQSKINWQLIYQLITSQEEGREAERWVGYVDWRSRPALRSKHGGMLAASFVLVVEIMENMAFLANASNLVTYLAEFMHFSPSRSATTVTNFMGTAFLLALLGGFLSDAFFTTYHIYLISALLEFLVQREMLQAFKLVLFGSQHQPPETKHGLSQSRLGQAMVVMLQVSWNPGLHAVRQYAKKK